MVSCRPSSVFVTDAPSTENIDAIFLMRISHVVQQSNRSQLLQQTSLAEEIEAMTACLQTQHRLVHFNIRQSPRQPSVLRRYVRLRHYSEQPTELVPSWPTAKENTQSRQFHANGVHPVVQCESKTSAQCRSIRPRKMFPYRGVVALAPRASTGYR